MGWFGSRLLYIFTTTDKTTASPHMRGDSSKTVFIPYAKKSRQSEVVMSEEQLFTAPSKETPCLKKSSYLCGVWSWQENTHFTHSYIHNIHKLEPIQAGLDADLWESRHKIGSDSILEAKSNRNGRAWVRKNWQPLFYSPERCALCWPEDVDTLGQLFTLSANVAWKLVSHMTSFTTMPHKLLVTICPIR